jgi:hypothetical protein
MKYAAAGRHLLSRPEAVRGLKCFERLGLELRHGHEALYR